MEINTEHSKPKKHKPLHASQGESPRDGGKSLIFSFHLLQQTFELNIAEHEREHAGKTPRQPPQWKQKFSVYYEMIWKCKLVWRRLISINSFFESIKSQINILTSFQLPPPSTSHRQPHTTTIVVKCFRVSVFSRNFPPTNNNTWFNQAANSKFHNKNENIFVE